MSCCSFLDLMWSLNPIELQGIVVRPSLPQSPLPTHPSHPQAFLCSWLPPTPPLSSSSTVPTQNFFKCLIFPPLASFLQAPSHLFVHRFFIPLQPLPPSASSPPTSLYSSQLSPSIASASLPSVVALFCCWCKLIYILLIYFNPVALVIPGR